MTMEIYPGPNFQVVTAPAGDSTNRIADTQFVTNAIASATLSSAVNSISTNYFLSENASTGAVTLTGALTATTASLGADVNLNNTTTYFDGPSVAQGTIGTWYVSGTVCCLDSTGVTPQFYCKLWDNTTLIDTAASSAPGTNTPIAISLSGYIASPAANLRISVRSLNGSGKILFNQTGNSKDSTISAIRIA